MNSNRIKGTEFDRRIADLRAERGNAVQLEEVADVVESIVGTIEGDISAVDAKIHKELTDLVNYIQQARDEIAEIKPAELHSVHIPTATDELDAVIEATAEATNVILDAAEQLGQLAPTLPDSAAKQIEGITTKIFEASNFQDITGQRISKVVKTLRHIEERIIRLARAIGDEIPKHAPASDVAISTDDESALLNGPQLPTKANSQADIDALLASFE